MTTDAESAAICATKPVCRTLCWHGTGTLHRCLQIQDISPVLSGGTDQASKCAGNANSGALDACSAAQVCAHGLQGMAFVAGVILMYLPEEPAFRVLCQLLDGPGTLTNNAN